MKRYLLLAITACVGIAVTGCGSNSVKSPPTAKEVTQEVETHRKYYNREKDECTMPDGGVLLNYSKWMNANGGGFGGDVADDCGLYRDSTKSAVDYAKEYPQGLVAPGRYDMLVRRKLMDKEEAAAAAASEKRLEDWAIRASDAEQKHQERCQDQLENRGYGDAVCY